MCQCLLLRHDFITMFSQMSAYSMDITPQCTCAQRHRIQDALASSRLSTKPAFYYLSSLLSGLYASLEPAHECSQDTLHMLAERSISWRFGQRFWIKTKTYCEDENKWKKDRVDTDPIPRRLLLPRRPMFSSATTSSHRIHTIYLSSLPRRQQ
jgi:hypothetical protein